MNLDAVAAAAGLAGHIAIASGVGLRVIWVRRPAGSAYAWLFLVVALPLVGLVLYGLFGERPIGRRRLRRAQAFYRHMAEVATPLWASDVVDAQALAPRWRGLARLAQAASGLPVLGASTLALHDGAHDILRAIVADIDRAAYSVDMAFYIWNAGGTADEVQAALERASARGVRCRVLLDALGSKPFLRGSAPGRMRAAGIALEAALTIGPLGMIWRRADLRLHRKIVVVDERIAYTGSMNLVDPRFFKQDAGVGEWIDAMARIEGPAVAALRAVFLFDWCLQTGAEFAPSADEAFAARRAVQGPARVQVVPSGPGVESAANLRILVDAVAAARGRVLLTTPYFVPDPALALALQNAALRGVAVTIILPAANDSVLVRYASRGFYDELLAAGVRLLEFDGGLLHTKSVTVDEDFALFGTVNLDMRSLHLNYELMLAAYDPGFNAALTALQRGYERGSRAVDGAAWAARPARERLLEGAASLVAPLL